MGLAAGLLNLILGSAYVGYGVMTAMEMRRDWRLFGLSRFGLAWLFMAFTCGPHHLVHGGGILLLGHAGGPLDVAVVAAGLPAGVAWLLLRIEAFAGGRGDRFVAGTPAWVAALPTVAGAYLAAVVAAGILAGGLHASHPSVAVMIGVNLVLVVLYMEIGRVLLRTQLRNRGPMGGWSLSGLALTAVFPTCALMHGVWALYAGAGLYGHNPVAHVIDVLSIPASIYFLWVIRRLYRNTLRDWSAPAGAPA